MMIRTILLVGLGGFLGSVCRYLTTALFTRLLPGVFPYGTFTANIVGCLLIGLVYSFSERLGWLTPEWRFFLATGFCGGYTTFSSFAYENIRMLQEDRYLTFAIYSISSFAIGLFAVWIGITIARALS